MPPNTFDSPNAPFTLYDLLRHCHPTRAAVEPLTRQQWQAISRQLQELLDVGEQLERTASGLVLLLGLLPDECESMGLQPFHGHALRGLLEPVRVELSRQASVIGEAVGDISVPVPAEHATFAAAVAAAAVATAETAAAAGQ